MEIKSFSMFSGTCTARQVVRQCAYVIQLLPFRAKDGSSQQELKRLFDLKNSASRTP